MAEEVRSLIAQSAEDYRVQDYEKALAGATRACDLALVLGDGSEERRQALLNLGVYVRFDVYMHVCMTVSMYMYVCMNVCSIGARGNAQ